MCKQDRSRHWLGWPISCEQLASVLLSASTFLALSCTLAEDPKESNQSDSSDSTDLSDSPSDEASDEGSGEGSSEGSGDASELDSSDNDSDASTNTEADDSDGGSSDSDDGEASESSDDLSSENTSESVSDESSSDTSQDDSLEDLLSSITPDEIADHIEFLASDAMNGRGSRTPDGQKAAEYVVKNFEAAGIEPFGDNGTWYAALSQSGYSPNVVGIVRGSSEGYIVLSAHYDHLEPASSGSDRIYNGADDNASGTAAILEIAQALGQARGLQPKASIILIAFSAEELGLLGSHDWVDKRVVEPDQILGVSNMDMISRNHDNVIFCEGADDYPKLAQAVDDANDLVNLDIMFDMHPEWTSQSDHYPFIQAGIPALYFGVEDHPDYHKVTDSADKTIPGLTAKVARLALAWAFFLEN
jgi:hypothetical protein